MNERNLTPSNNPEHSPERQSSSQESQPDTSHIKQEAKELVAKILGEARHAEHVKDDLDNQNDDEDQNSEPELDLQGEEQEGGIKRFAGKVERRFKALFNKNSAHDHLESFSDGVSEKVDSLVDTIIEQKMSQDTSAKTDTQYQQVIEGFIDTFDKALENQSQQGCISREHKLQLRQVFLLLADVKEIQTIPDTKKEQEKSTEENNQNLTRTNQDINNIKGAERNLEEPAQENNSTEKSNTEKASTTPQVTTETRRKNSNIHDWQEAIAAKNQEITSQVSQRTLEDQKFESRNAVSKKLLAFGSRLLTGLGTGAGGPLAGLATGSVASVVEGAGKTASTEAKSRAMLERDRQELESQNSTEILYQNRLEKTKQHLEALRDRGEFLPTEEDAVLEVIPQAPSQRALPPTEEHAQYLFPSAQDSEHPSYEITAPPQKNSETEEEVQNLDAETSSLAKTSESEAIDAEIIDVANTESEQSSETQEDQILEPYTWAIKRFNAGAEALPAEDIQALRQKHYKAFLEQNAENATYITKNGELTTQGKSEFQRTWRERAQSFVPLETLTRQYEMQTSDQEDQESAYSASKKYINQARRHLYTRTYENSDGNIISNEDYKNLSRDEQSSYSFKNREIRDDLDLNQHQELISQLYHEQTRLENMKELFTREGTKDTYVDTKRKSDLDTQLAHLQAIITDIEKYDPQQKVLSHIDNRSHEATEDVTEKHQEFQDTINSYKYRLQEKKHGVITTKNRLKTWGKNTAWAAVGNTLAGVGASQWAIGNTLEEGADQLGQDAVDMTGQLETGRDLEVGEHVNDQMSGTWQEQAQEHAREIVDPQMTEEFFAEENGNVIEDWRDTLDQTTREFDFTEGSQYLEGGQSLQEQLLDQAQNLQFRGTAIMSSIGIMESLSLLKKKEQPSPGEKKIRQKKIADLYHKEYQAKQRMEHIKNQHEVVDGIIEDETEPHPSSQEQSSQTQETSESPTSPERGINSEDINNFLDTLGIIDLNSQDQDTETRLTEITTYLSKASPTVLTPLIKKGEHLYLWGEDRTKQTINSIHHQLQTLSPEKQKDFTTELIKINKTLDGKPHDKSTSEKPRTPDSPEEEATSTDQPRLSATEAHEFSISTEGHEYNPREDPFDEFLNIESMSTFFQNPDATDSSSLPNKERFNALWTEVNKDFHHFPEGIKDFITRTNQSHYFMQKTEEGSPTPFDVIKTRIEGTPSQQDMEKLNKQFSYISSYLSSFKKNETSA